MTDKPPPSFLDYLKARSANAKIGAGGRNRAAFLAVKRDVEVGLENQFPVTQIWAALVEQGRIDFSYQWFAKYVRDLIRASEPPSSIKAQAAPASGQDDRLPGPAQAPSPPIASAVAAPPSTSQNFSASPPTETPEPRPSSAMERTFKVSRHANPKDLIGE